MTSWFKGVAFTALWCIGSLAVAATPVTVPAGTAVRLRLLDTLSSATATEGQHFNLALDEPLSVDGRVVVPAGTRAVGTVVTSKKKGFLGRGGALDVRIDYLLVDGQQIPLTAASSSGGADKVGTTVALTVLFGPLGLLKRGHDIELEPGAIFPAYVDHATPLSP